MKKKVIITGGNRGIGLALVSKFLEEGYFVIATSRNGKIGSIQHSDLVVVPLDITSASAISAAVTMLEKDFGTIDLVINNAGVGLDLEDLQPDIDKIRATFDTNVFGLVHFTEACLPILAENATILNISSVMGMLERDKAVANATAYRMSKAAVNMYTKTLSARMMERNITVPSIHPGWVKTDMGGEGADITAAESANGIFALYDKNLPTGTFWAAENQVALNW
jgi:NAD(P)-dependent dehydrogenase (short-subunit alcohol dehydrogenase family)